MGFVDLADEAGGEHEHIVGLAGLVDEACTKIEYCSCTAASGEYELHLHIHFLPPQGQVLIGPHQGLIG